MLRRALSMAALSLSVLVSVGCQAVPALAATDPYSGIDCAKAPDTTICKSTTGDPISAPNGILAKVTKLVATVGGAVAIIVIIVAGIRYIVSGGDAEQVAKSKRTLVYAAIGLLVMVLARLIIIFVIDKV